MPDIRIPSGSSTAAAANTASRQQTQMSALGITGENFPRGALVGSSIMVTGTMYYTAMGLLVGDVVTNLLPIVQALGSGFSGVGMRVGIYSKTGAALLASSGDVSASFGAVGAKTIALTTPFTAPTTDGYWFNIIAIATTPPTLNRGATTAQGYAFAGASMGAYGALTAQTDLPASFTPAYGAAAGLNYYMGWS